MTNREKDGEAWKELEEAIVELIKEHYRLMGKTVYEPLPLELEAKIKGGG